MRHAQPLRVSQAAGIAAGIALLLVVNSALTAPSAPSYGDAWRWMTIAGALVLCAFNVLGIRRAYRRVGLLSSVAFLQLWCLLAFSFPAAEMTYRYDRLQLGRWRIMTNDPSLLRVVFLAAVFQVGFFLALGHAHENALARRLLQSRAPRPDRPVALVMLLASLPLLVARLLVVRNLGFQGAVQSAVTRTDYFSHLDSGVSAPLWALNTLFPIYAVSLICLAVKFLVRHPSTLGRNIYLMVLLTCSLAVALSGGRAEIAYVLLTVVLFMYVGGYRSARQFVPVLVPMALVGALLFLIAQARLGESNLLSQVAGDPYVGYSYAGGDISQVLGLGRADTLTLILDQHHTVDDLHGRSYVFAVAGGLNTLFVPRIAAGANLPTYHVSDEVLGRWIFGGPVTSALPSAPGELYLNWGWLGVVIGAVVLGLVFRLLLTMLVKLPTPFELAWLLVLWTLARLLSDESYVIAGFASRNWPVMLAVTLALSFLKAHRDPPHHAAGQRAPAAPPDRVLELTET